MSTSYPLIERALKYPYVYQTLLSPDSSWVVYALREAHMTEDASAFLVRLYRVPASGGAPLRLTHGPHSAYHARFSPDGRFLAYLSSRSGRGNLHAMAMEGGEAWQLTDYRDSDVQTFEWSPDGQTIAFSMAPPPLPEARAAMAAKDDAYVWGEHFPRARLYRIRFEIGPSRMPPAVPLTPAGMHIMAIDWFPDGKSIAFTHRPSPLIGESPNTGLATVSLESSAPGSSDDSTRGAKDAESEPPITEIAQVSDWFASLTVSPDGAWIACPTWIQPHVFAEGNRVVLYSRNGEETRELAVTPDELSIALGWSPDSQSVYVSEFAGIESQILRIPISGEAPHPVAESASYKDSIAINARGDIVFAARDFAMPHTIRRLDSQTGQCHDIVVPALEPNDWLASFGGAVPPAPRVELMSWPAPAGKRELGRDEIDGFVVYPRDYQPGQRYPLVVDIHGGPAMAFSRDYLPGEIQYGPSYALSQRGFVVLRCNPRGSLGYGRKFRWAIFGQWGAGDMPDIMAGVDALIEKGIVDPDRMAVLGASHGGFLAAYIIGQTDRFHAACAASAVTDLVSFTGTCDLPGYVADSLESEHWQDPELYRSLSPIAHAASISTPLLIQHGESDVRVPIGQSHELYYALQRCGVPCELVIYPRQPHGFVEPRMHLDAQRRAIAWIERWLDRWSDRWSDRAE